MGGRVDGRLGRLCVDPLEQAVHVKDVRALSPDFQRDKGEPQIRLSSKKEGLGERRTEGAVVPWDLALGTRRVEGKTTDATDFLVVVVRVGRGLVGCQVPAPDRDRLVVRHAARAVVSFSSRLSSELTA